MKKILYIVGPTASGKTQLAFNLSASIGCVLISADSRQVYQGLDIISGKDIPLGAPFKIDSNLKDIHSDYSIGYFLIKKTPLFMLDVVKPSYSFSVADFQTISLEVIHKAWLQKRLPIVVGGSGFYIESLLTTIGTVNIPVDTILRKKLAGESLAFLQQELMRVDKMRFNSMNASDVKNARRLIRAIEIAKFKEDKNFEHKKYAALEQDALVIGLQAERGTLKNIIDKRVDKRIEQGAFEEARTLFFDFDKLSNQVKSSNGYTQLFSFMNQEISKDEAITRWKRSEYLIAKKQMTWFHKNKNIIWFNSQDKDLEKNVLSLVMKWYNNNNL